MEKFEELKALLESLNEDVAKFSEKGNKAAGTRIRVAMQKVKVLAQDVRLHISRVKQG